MRQRVVGDYEPDHVEGAEVHEHVVAHRQDPSVFRRRDRDAMDLVARVCGCGEVLAALLEPAHRLPELACREHYQHVLGVLDALLAESAPDVASDDANPLDRLAQRAREDGLQHVRRLGAGPDRECAAERLHCRQYPARLERRSDIAMRAQLLFDHDRRAGERFVGQALLGRDRQREVIRPAGLEERRVGGEGRDRVEDDRQRFVVDLDLLRRIDRRVAVFGDDHGDRLTDVGHFRRREQRDRVQSIEGLQLAQEPLGCVDLARDADRLGASRDVRRGEDGDDAGHRARGGHVDPRRSSRARAGF